MFSRHRIASLSVWVVFLGLLATLPLFAGSAVVGSVAGTMNATVGGQTLFPNTTLFSGDKIQVKEGVAVVALGSSSRLVLGRETEASFLRESNQVTVLLGQGNVSVSHEVDGMPVRMKIGDVTVVPVAGFKTLGEVAMLNGAIVVTAKEGTFRVEGNGQTVNVVKGKTITVVPRVTAPPDGPPPGGNSAGRVWHDTWGITGTAAAAVAAILAGLDLSRSGDAKDNAAAAESQAAAAAAAASAAASAAAAAASAAQNASNCAADTYFEELSPDVPAPYPCTT